MHVCTGDMLKQHAHALCTSRGKARTAQSITLASAHDDREQRLMGLSCKCTAVQTHLAAGGVVCARMHVLPALGRAIN
jgi:hypothetical protein